MASFVDGLDVTTSLRRSTGRRKRCHREQVDTDKQSNALSRSLQRSPWIIGQEYENGLRRAGPRFAHGDGIAHTRLNEILLRLNTGLVNIIATFLDHGPHNAPQLDYRAMTTLSDVSRRDSINVLHQLYQRLTSRRLPAVMPVPKQTNARPRDARSRSVPVARSPKIRGPTLAQVTIEDSSKRPQLAIVKPAANATKKKTRSPAERTPSDSSSATLVNSSELSLDSRKSSRPKPLQKSTSSPRLKQQSSTATLKRAPQPTNSRKKAPLATKSQPNLLQDISRPPLPAIPARMLHATRAKEDTPTIYSIASDSTKLGEIPMHRWAVPYDYDETSLLNRQAMQNGWPIRDVDGELLVRPKRKFNWFGLRKQRIAA